MSVVDTAALSCALLRFRVQAELEAEIPCHGIGTTLGCALVDVCQALGLTERQIQIVIGGQAYRAILDQAIPFRLVQEADNVRQTEGS